MGRLSGLRPRVKTDFPLFYPSKGGGNVLATGGAQPQAPQPRPYLLRAQPRATPGAVSVGKLAGERLPAGRATPVPPQKEAEAKEKKEDGGIEPTAQPSLEQDKEHQTAHRQPDGCDAPGSEACELRNDLIL